MALLQELTMEQLLQGLQRKEPRLYDLMSNVIDNLKNIAVETGIDVPRTLRLQTTGGRPANVSEDDEEFYNIIKAVSLRI